MFGKLRDSWVVWRRKVGEILHAHSETLEDYGDKLDTYNPVEKTEDMSTPVGVDTEGKLWTSGGESGETREPDASFDVASDTSYTLSEDEAFLFGIFSLTADYYINNKQFSYYSTNRNEQNIIFEYYDDDGDNLVFTANNTFTTITVTSSISGTVKMFIDENKNVSLNALYNNNTITITEPYSVIEKLIERPLNGALVVHIANDGAVGVGYLTIATVYSGGTKTINISCDININGKFNFTVDANDQIVGTHSS